MADQPRGNSVNNGNSFANGSAWPKWAREWEFVLLREMLTDRWKVEA